MRRESAPAERAATSQQAAAAIGKAIRPKEAEMPELAFRQKRPLREVAVRLDISLSAAKSRSSRLRQRITALARELLAD
ncbi:MAG: hypothetical protein LBO04_05645 [Spirochaetaceae bacterium]|jgi:DNA-directed RNA polymerase specialized sigma24 family protein|nr:hypothetical protein [Spirochaetaceae bacterium]